MSVATLAGTGMSSNMTPRPTKELGFIRTECVLVAENKVPPTKDNIEEPHPQSCVQRGGEHCALDERINLD